MADNETSITHNNGRFAARTLAGEYLGLEEIGSGDPFYIEIPHEDALIFAKWILESLGE